MIIMSRNIPDMSRSSDPIPPETAVTLDGLFHERARRSPQALAYRYWHEAAAEWRDYSWAQMVGEIARWQAENGQVAAG